MSTLLGLGEAEFKLLRDARSLGRQPQHALALLEERGYIESRKSLSAKNRARPTRRPKRAARIRPLSARARANHSRLRAFGSFLGTSPPRVRPSMHRRRNLPFRSSSCAASSRSFGASVASPLAAPLPCRRPKRTRDQRFDTRDLRARSDRPSSCSSPSHPGAASGRSLCRLIPPLFTIFPVGTELE